MSTSTTSVQSGAVATFSDLGLVLPAHLSRLANQPCLCVELTPHVTHDIDFAENTFWTPDDMLGDPMRFPLSPPVGLECDDSETLWRDDTADALYDLCADLIHLVRPYIIGRAIVRGYPTLTWDGLVRDSFAWFLGELDTLLGSTCFQSVCEEALRGDDSELSNLKYRVQDRVRARLEQRIFTPLRSPFAWGIKRALGAFSPPDLNFLGTPRFLNSNGQWVVFDSPYCPDISACVEDILERCSSDDGERDAVEDIRDMTENYPRYAGQCASDLVEELASEIRTDLYRDAVAVGIRHDAAFQLSAFRPSLEPSALVLRFPPRLPSLAP
jgi:hypothetical protein